VSSDSGHDAASESLDLMLTTTLSRHVSVEPVVRLHDDDATSDLHDCEQSQSCHDDAERRHSVDSAADERCSHDASRDASHDAVCRADAGRADVDRFYDAVELSRDAATHSTVSSVTHGTVSDGTVWPSGTVLCNGRVYESGVSSPRLHLLLSSLALSLMFIVCGLTVLTYIVLESDTDLAIVSSVRRLPEVCQFYRDHYVPWRNWLIGPHHHSHWPCVTHRPQGRKSSSERRRSKATV